MKRENRLLCMALCGLMLSMCACGEVDYPDGDALPTFTTTTPVQVIYDTAPPIVTDTGEYTVQTTDDTEIPVIYITTAPEEETEYSYSDREPETTASSLRLEDVTEVGLSEYYNKTQTQTTVTTPEEVTMNFYPGDDDSPAQTSVTTAEESITTVFYETTVSSADSSGLHTYLRDGRISSITGKEIISHPHCYYSFNEKEKMIYDRMVTALLNYEETSSFKSSEKVRFDDIFKVYEIIYNFEYRLFNLTTTIEYHTDPDSGYISDVKYSYSCTKEETERRQAEIDKNVSAIMAKISTGMSDYEIVKIFHDSVISMCTYEENEDQNTIYGCLGKKTALCQGYTRAMAYLCGEVGIKTAAVQGIANEEHMWNIVQMDGEYYHVDLTWDDPDRKNDPGSVRYDYFGLTDERIKELRQVDDTWYSLPPALGTKYNYYSYNGLVANSVDEACRIFREQVLAKSEEGASTVQLVCSSDEVFSQVTGLFFGNTEQNVLGMMTDLLPKAKNKYSTDSVTHNTNKYTRTVKVYLEY